MKKEISNNSMHKEFSKVTLYLCIRSILAIALFLAAAIYFDKWWPILFSLAFCGSATMKDGSDDKKKSSVEIKGD